MRRPTAAATLLVAATLSLPAPARSGDVVTGKASHYGPGSGVAMNFCTWTLRHAVGCGSVRVTSLQTGRSVVAPVIDWCECVVPGSGSPYRVIDLQYGVVDALGLNLEAGIYDVSVERLDGGVLPNTSTVNP